MSTAAQARPAGLSPEVRTNLLLAALPLGMALVARGVNELDKIIQGRFRRLAKLELAIRAAEVRLGSLGGRPQDVDDQADVVEDSEPGEDPQPGTEGPSFDQGERPSGRTFPGSRLFGGPANTAAVP